MTPNTSDGTYGSGSLRAFRPFERELVTRLLGSDFPGREEVIEQLRDARVREIDENGSLAIVVGAAQCAPVVHRVPVEAEGRDVDGVSIYALLHVVEGIAQELEFYRADGSQIRRWPSVDTFSVFAPPAPTPRGSSLATDE